MSNQIISCTYSFDTIHCEECGEDASPGMDGGAIVDWSDPKMGQQIMCAECIELHQNDLYAVVFDWRDD